MLKNGHKLNPELLENSRRRGRRVHFNLIQLSTAWKTSCDFYHNKHTQFVQTYCGDLDAASDMQHHKDQEFRKTTERINKFLKKRTENWSKLKSRVDKQAEIVPERCLNKIVTNKYNSAQIFEQFYERDFSNIL